MRWMPDAARALFEAELDRTNKEGQKLIFRPDLWRCRRIPQSEARNTGSSISMRCIAQLGRPGQVTRNVIAKVLESLKDRLEKAQSTNFMPKLSYSSITFTSTDNAFASPWGQAYSLLSDAGCLPTQGPDRQLLLSRAEDFQESASEAMNVADDALLRDSGTLELEDRCKTELDILSRDREVPDRIEDYAANSC